MPDIPSPIPLSTDPTQRVAWQDLIIRRPGAGPTTPGASDGADLDAHASRLFLELGYRLTLLATPREVALVLIEVADDLFGWDAAAVDLLAESDSMSYSLISVDRLEDGERYEVETAYHAIAPDSMLRRTLDHGALLIQTSLERDRQDSTLRTFGNPRPSESLMYVPIRMAGANFGMLTIQSYVPRRYTGENLSLLQSLADYGAGALARTFAEEKLRRSERARLETVEELERSNAELQQFAYVASHDLQEPLRMVSSYMQLISRRYKGRLDADADEFIHYAVDGATRMRALIGDLLAYSRVGARRPELQAVDTRVLVDEVLKNLVVAIEESAAIVDIGPLPTIPTEAGSLGQVFQNLIGNAVKFRAPDRPPHLRIGAERRGAEWVFWVADNGIGIDAENHQRVFLLFQRLHPRTDYPGTGIGLAICRKIVEGLGGKIWIESTEGHGTTLRFTLPARE